MSLGSALPFTLSALTWKRSIFVFHIFPFYSISRNIERDFFSMYFIQQYFICRPSDFTVSENLGAGD
jgi:hypothetical protein